MVEYADYAFYVETAHGNKIPETEFPRAALKASIFIKYMTVGRVSDSFESDYPDYVEDIKLATCAAADVFYEAEVRRQEHGGREALSENTDGYSVTFADVETKSGSYEERRAAAEIRPYLVDTGLLYRGV